VIRRRTPAQVAAADNVRRARKYGPEAVDRAKRLQADVEAAARNP